MPAVDQPPGLRERNKQQKFDRIKKAASELFARHGVDEVTTSQIASRAGVGSGTIFLYAKSKGELLLLVQNAHYVDALAEGISAAEAQTDIVEAVASLLGPIVLCNRTHIGNGRIYLREMIFGDPGEPHRQEALTVAADTEHAIECILNRHDRLGAGDAATLARIVSSVMFLALATADGDADTSEIVDQIHTQIVKILPH